MIIHFVIALFNINLLFNPLLNKKLIITFFVNQSM